MLVPKHHLFVQLGVALGDFRRHPGAQVETVVAGQQVVLEVQTLVSGELFPQVDPELLSARCCGASC